MIRTRLRTRGGGVSSGPSLPFSSTSDTYWWDFTSSSNTYEDTGDDTISYVVEQRAGLTNFYQLTKDDQPLKVTDGANFNTASTRYMLTEDVSDLANGKNGYYIAGVAKWDTANGGLLWLDTTADITAYLTASRNLATKLNGSFVAYSSALTLGQWYAFGLYLNTDTDEARIYIDGSEVTPAFTATGPWATFASDPATSMKIGAESSTLNGALKHLIYHNGAPSDEIIASMNAFLVSEKP